MKNKIKPIGEKVLVEYIDKPNKEDKTSFGIIVPKKDEDSHDRAMLKGQIISKGHLKDIDFELNSVVFFNRYEAFIVANKGLKQYWLVNVKDIWGATK